MPGKKDKQEATHPCHPENFAEFHKGVLQLESQYLEASAAVLSSAGGSTRKSSKKINNDRLISLSMISHVAGQDILNTDFATLEKAALEAAAKAKGDDLSDAEVESTKALTAKQVTQMKTLLVGLVAVTYADIVSQHKNSFGRHFYNSGSRLLGLINELHGFSMWYKTNISKNPKNITDTFGAVKAALANPQFIKTLLKKTEINTLNIDFWNKKIEDLSSWVVRRHTKALSKETPTSTSTKPAVHM